MSRSHTYNLRGDFLEYRVIGAQKYRHALRENGAFVVFAKMAGSKFKSINYWPNIRVGSSWILK